MGGAHVGVSSATRTIARHACMNEPPIFPGVIMTRTTLTISTIAVASDRSHQRTSSAIHHLNSVVIKIRDK